MQPTSGRNQQMGHNDSSLRAGNHRAALNRVRLSHANRPPSAALQEPPVRNLTVPQVACIIPVVGSTEGLEATLLSILERRPDGCEILLVANVAYDDPYGLQGEIQILNAPRTAGLVECINLGIQAAQAPIVHILVTGMQASDGWLDRATAHFGDPFTAAVAPAIYDAADPQKLIATGIAYRPTSSRVICITEASDASPTPAPIGPLVQAAFYRKSAIESLGGLSTAVGDESVDVDLALTLRRAGWKTCQAPDCRVLATSIDFDRPTSPLTASLHAERLYWRHACEVSWIHRLFLHPLATAFDIVLAKPWWKAPVRAFGRLLAVCQLGHYAQFRGQVEACGASLRATVAELAKSQQPIEPSAKRALGKIQRIDSAHAGVDKSETDRSRARNTSGRR
jgi:GT2 family glycosyltransferase